MTHFPRPGQVDDFSRQPRALVQPWQKFVLIRQELYDSLTDYDDSPWTDEEMDLLAVEVDAMLDDDMAIEGPAP